jgi:hypothetical protein
MRRAATGWSQHLRLSATAGFIATSAVVAMTRRGVASKLHFISAEEIVRHLFIKSFSGPSKSPGNCFVPS